MIAETYIREYIPASWFHPVGVHKVVARLKDRLPDVGGKLFLTFTLDPEKFEDEEAAFEIARKKLRKVFYKLRRGVAFEGKRYVIDSAYCVKVEFHQSGWAHFHVIFLTRRFLPGGLLNELWGLGRTEVKRIDKDIFHYLLKYVTKPADLPEWIKKRKRLRVFQSGRGFLLPKPEIKAEKVEEVQEVSKEEEVETPKKRKRASYTLGERLRRWECTLLIVCGDHYNSVVFAVPFREMFNRIIYEVVMDGRYLGNGKVRIDQRSHVEQWSQAQQQVQREPVWEYSYAA